MEPKDYIALIGVVISLLSAAISGLAIYRTGVHAERQRELQKRLNEEEQTIENRRFFTVLWDKMTDLNYIDPDKPVGPDVRKAINTLEAVAMCWEAGIIDKKMVVIAFGTLFDDLYSQIDRINRVPGMDKTGHQLLTQNRVIPLVHKQIQDELNKQGVIT